MTCALGLDSTASPPTYMRRFSIHMPLDKACIVQEVVNRADLSLRDVTSTVGRASLELCTRK